MRRDEASRAPPSPDARPRTRLDLTRLVDVARDLSATLDPREVERRVIRHTRRILGATSCRIFVEDGRGLAGVESHGEEIADGVLDELRARAVDSAAPIADESGATLAVRLRGNERVLGVLAVRRRVGTPIHAGERALLALLAQLAATALENAWLFTEARITDVRLRESEKLAALGRLSAGLAHELRNPLNTLSILTFAMLEGADDRHRADLAIVRDEIGRMDFLLEQFLDFARPRPPRCTRISVFEVIERTLRLVAPEAGKRRVAIGLSADDGTRPVWADRDQLNQVFLNLSLNALQAIGRDGRIEVSLRPARGGVLVRLIDDGPGIPVAVRARLFEPFVTTKSEGSGLGLAVARRIVEAHSGWLAIESLPARGAAATVWLPS